MRSWTLRALACAALMAAAVNTSAGEGEVTVRLFQFQPGEVTVKAGGSVVWTNQDEIKHTVTGEAFTLVLAGKGATASHRFTEPGVYRYRCERHPNMRGEIRVN